jgi:hypothetical protein
MEEGSLKKGNAGLKWKLRQSQIGPGAAILAKSTEDTIEAAGACEWSVATLK